MHEQDLGVTTECVGYCEVCGLYDLHLIFGECPQCRDKSVTVDARLGAEADVRHVLDDEDAA